MSFIIYASNVDLFMENYNIRNEEINTNSDSYIGGCAIYAHSGKCNEITLLGVDITNYCNREGMGGRIYAKKDNESVFYIENNESYKTVLKNCISLKYHFDYLRVWEKLKGNDKEGGRGGGIFKYVQSNPKKLKADIEFGTEEREMNETLEGYDIYIRVEIMWSILNCDNFLCLKGKGKDYEGDMEYDESNMYDDGSFDLIEYLNKSKGNKGLFEWLIIIIIIVVSVVVGLIIIVAIVMGIILIVYCCRKDNRNKTIGNNNVKQSTCLETIVVETDVNSTPQTVYF